MTTTKSHLAAAALKYHADMPKVAKTVLVPYAAETMFDLVDAVERYPEFLPWCGGTQVLARDVTTTIARIDIRYAGVSQSFVTENAKKRGQWMHIALKEGPFKSLLANWWFRPLAAEACKVEFDIDFVIANAVLDKAIGPVFGMIADTMLARFVARAEALAAQGQLPPAPTALRDPER